MALWKPFRGNRASLDSQPLHDGYAYFCVDDGTFHIDYTDADGNLQRRQIKETLHKTEEEWDASGYIAGNGEIVIYDQDDNYHYPRIKIGNGTIQVAQLPFAALPTIESLDNSRLINYGEDEYYFSQTLYDKFRKMNRVYVERGHVLDEETGKWRWRGPYPMYTLSYGAGKLANPWYYKETWYETYWNNNNATLFDDPDGPYYNDGEGKGREAFVEACKEGTYDIPAPTDDDYPALDSVAQRLGASGNIVVPRTPTGATDASSKGYVDDREKAIRNDLTASIDAINEKIEEKDDLRPQYVRTPGVKAIGINKSIAGYKYWDFKLTGEQYSAPYYVLEADMYAVTEAWGSGIQFSLKNSSNAELAWVVLKSGTHGSIIAKNSSGTNKASFTMDGALTEDNYTHIRIEYHNLDKPLAIVYLNDQKVAEQEVDSVHTDDITSCRAACTSAYIGYVEISNIALINSNVAGYRITANDYLDLTTYAENEGLVVADKWGVTSPINNDNLVVNKLYLDAYTNDVLKGNLALGEGTEIGGMKGIPAYGFVAEVEDNSATITQEFIESGMTDAASSSQNMCGFILQASRPIPKDIEVEVRVRSKEEYWSEETWSTEEEWNDYYATATLKAGEDYWEIPVTEVDWSLEYYEEYILYDGNFPTDGNEHQIIDIKEHQIINLNSVENINVDDTYSIYQTAPAKTYINVGKVISIEGNKLYVDTLPTLDTPAAGNKYYLMIDGKELGEPIAEYQVVLGKYNEPIEAAYLVVGNGTSDTDRSNAFAVYEDGRIAIGADPVEDMDVAPKHLIDDLDEKIDSVGSSANKALNDAVTTINTKIDNNVSTLNTKITTTESNIKKDTASKYVPIIKSNTTYDKAYVEFANDGGRDTGYAITGEPTIIANEKVIPYVADAGYFKNRYPENATDWADVTDDTMNSFVTDPTPNTGALSSRISSATYTDNRTVLQISKNYDNATGSGDQFILLPQLSETDGHKFVFETEISWDGPTASTKAGQWCARMRFINSSETKMWSGNDDNVCDIGYDKLQTGSNEASFSIGPKASYIAANKVASNKTWASLRFEMIDKTFVVFINDKEAYRETRDTFLSTLDNTLGGVTLEFREAAQGTTFYFNNTFVGTVNEDFFGRPIPSIPQRLDNGQINVPVNPVDDSNAASKAYVDGLLTTIDELRDTIDSLQASLEESKSVIETLEDKIESIGNDRLVPTEGLAYELSKDGVYYICRGIGTATDTDIIIASTIEGVPVTVIGNDAFANKSITSVVIPEGIDHIGYRTFKQCTKLTTITIPSTLTTISGDAFYGCSNLKNVYINDIAAWCHIHFQDEDSSPLHAGADLYLNGKLVTELVIPDGVTSIGRYAFRECTSLTSVTIPDSVTSIGNYAFYKCSNLANIYVNWAYTPPKDDTWITQVTAQIYYAPLSYTLSENGAYYICDGLGDVKDRDVFIPPTHLGIPVTTIAEEAFTNARLNSITIPASIVHINGGALYNAAKSITINMTNPQSWENDGLGNSKTDAYRTVAHYPFQEARLVINTEDNSERWSLANDTYLSQLIVGWTEDWNASFDENAPWGASRAVIKYAKPATDGLAYQKISGGYACTGIGTATETDIIIADEIDGVPVIEVARSAFADSRIESIVLPVHLRYCDAGSLSTSTLKTVTFTGYTDLVEHYSYIDGTWGEYIEGQPVGMFEKYSINTDYDEWTGESTVSVSTTPNTSIQDIYVPWSEDGSYNDHILGDGCKTAGGALNATMHYDYIYSY